MKNKILISSIILVLFTVVLCTSSFATNMMQSAGNTLKNAGNSIGNAAAKTGNTIVNGTKNLVNGAATLGNDMMDGTNDMRENDSTTMYQGNTDYTATRTATDGTGLFGMSPDMSTWLILGVVGAIIIGLIWYYGAQFEHRDYNNE